MAKQKVLSVVYQKYVDSVKKDYTYILLDCALAGYAGHQHPVSIGLCACPRLGEPSGGAGHDWADRGST